MNTSDQMQIVVLGEHQRDKLPENTIHPKVMNLINDHFSSSLDEGEVLYFVNDQSFFEWLEKSGPEAAYLILPHDEFKLSNLRTFLCQDPYEECAGFFLTDDFGSTDQLYWPIKSQTDHFKVSLIEEQDRDIYADALVYSEILKARKETLLAYRRKGMLSLIEDLSLAFLPRPGITWSHDQLKGALFLDRDGILIKDTGYLKKREEVQFREDALALMLKAKSLDQFIIILTNQSGVARGYFDESSVNHIHDYIEEHFSRLGVKIDAWYSSPYHYEKGVNEYKKKSLLRKPWPGMLLKALMDFPIDLGRSHMIGDKLSDHLCIDGPRYTLLQGRYDLSGAQTSVVEDLSQVIVD